MTNYRCFICERPGTVHLIGTVHACDEHMGNPDPEVVSVV